MPSTSPEQAKTMAALAHGWRPSDPKLARIPVGVAKEFSAADQAKEGNKVQVARALMGRR